MIQVSNLSKYYGSQELFQNVSFSVNPGERVGLVGRNGHGKTTLFRMIVGQEEPDSGVIATPKNYRIAYLQQLLQFSKPTVIEEVCLGLPPGQQHADWQAEKILFGLGFDKHDMLRPPADFSGGFQVRINLAKVLVSSPDLLLLDEPTNYLDIVSIRWLTRFLKAWKSEFLLITHDRGFMDSVVTHIVGIHRKKTKKIEGNTQKYYEQIAAEEEIYEKTRLNEEKRRKEVELFISRFRAKARLANLVQSRIKTLAKQDRRDKLAKIETLEFAFKSSPFPAKFMMDIKNIHFGYEAQLPDLINSLSITVAPNDRICIIGKNNCGKTTLLKVLGGKLQPQSGALNLHPSLQRGYFEQTNTAELDPEKSVEAEILYTDGDCTQQQARDIAGAMMFSGDQALKKISVLSGGEKSRVMLGKLLVSPCHMLLLDEPTNHLDMEASDSLLAAVDAFEGAVILVTHNEMFLHTVANRLIVFDRDKHFIYEGGYQAFLQQVGWQDDGPQDQAEKVSTDTGLGKSAMDKKALRKRKAEIIQQKSKKLTPLSTRISQLEHEIETLEADLHATNTRMVNASNSGDFQAITTLATQERELRATIDLKYAELDSVMQDFESQSRLFDEKLNELMDGSSIR